jgi:hypothetical protein
MIKFEDINRNKLINKIIDETTNDIRCKNKSYKLRNYYFRKILREKLMKVEDLIIMSLGMEVK